MDGHDLDEGVLHREDVAQRDGGRVDQHGVALDGGEGLVDPALERVEGLAVEDAELHHGGRVVAAMERKQRGAHVGGLLLRGVFEGLPVAKPESRVRVVRVAERFGQLFYSPAVFRQSFLELGIHCGDFSICGTDGKERVDKKLSKSIQSRSKILAGHFKLKICIHFTCICITISYK